MNSKTKIIVLHRRELLIGAIAAVIAILLLIFMISSLAGGSKDAAASSVNGAKSVSAGVSAPAMGICGFPQAASRESDRAVDKQNTRNSFNFFML